VRAQPFPYRFLPILVLLLATACSGAPAAAPTATAGVGGDEPTPIGVGPTPSSLAATGSYFDTELGVHMSYPEEMRLTVGTDDPSRYTISLTDPSERLVLQVAWVYEENAADLEAVVEQEMAAHPDLPIERVETQVSGLPGVALSPMPGREEVTHVYMPLGDRLYRIVYTEPEGRALLDYMHLMLPTAGGDPSTPPPTPTNLPPPTATATPAVVPAETPSPPPIAELPEGWSRMDLPDMNITVALPPGWQVTRLPGLYRFGPTTDFQDQWLSVGFFQDLPLEIEQLEPAARSLFEGQGETNLSAEQVTVAGLPAFAFRGFQHSCMRVLVPADGVVRELALESPACTTTGEPDPTALLLLEHLSIGASNE
jgi:hypothetical protein